MIDLALQIALNAHKGQVDKEGKPFILHPLRVAAENSHITHNDRDAIIVSLLHDVMEFPREYMKFSYTELYIHFGKKIVEAVKAISRIEGEDYEVYIKRVAKNKIGRFVKICDLNDNLLYWRKGCNAEMAKRYKKALKFLTEVKR